MKINKLHLANDYLIYTEAVNYLGDLLEQVVGLHDFKRLLYNGKILVYMGYEDGEYSGVNLADMDKNSSIKMLRTEHTLGSNGNGYYLMHILEFELTVNDFYKNFPTGLPEEKIRMDRLFKDLDDKDPSLRYSLGVATKTACFSRHEIENLALELNKSATKQEESLSNSALLMIAKALEHYQNQDNRRHTQALYFSDVLFEEGVKGLGDRTVNGLLSKAQKALAEARKK